MIKHRLLSKASLISQPAGKTMPMRAEANIDGGQLSYNTTRAGQPHLAIGHISCICPAHAYYTGPHESSIQGTSASLDLPPKPRSVKSWHPKP